MPDHAVSTDPAVQAQLDRLWALSPGADVLGLGRITALLDRLGNPERRLPPVFHVAGTNGKGSTCAFLRAMLEAAGYRVHVYSSPHLVCFNERIRIAGRLIADAALAPLLAEVLDVAGDLSASFFEVTTAAAFLAFARTPADACVIEVGLGGRLDATNVIPAPAVCGIAALGIDHEAFLLAPEAGTPPAPLDRIGFEKAGIAKPGVPLVVQRYPPSVAETVARVAAAQGAALLPRGIAWDAAIRGERIAYRDHSGDLDLPLPAMAGAFQSDNAALAVAMLRHQQAVGVDAAAMARGIVGAAWPARFQRLAPGPLADRVAPATVYLDGAHNASAAAAVRAVWSPASAEERVGLVVGVLANKDARALIETLAAPPGWCDVVAVPVPGHAHHAPDALAAIARGSGARADTTADLSAALDLLAPSRPARVLIAGSLYLAGEALRANDEAPA